MLVLSRKNGQEIQIGPDIMLKVLSVEGNRVRLGIEAPRDYHILRGELADWLKDGRTVSIPLDTDINVTAEAG